MKFLLIKIKLLLLFPSYITFDFEGVQWGKMESFLYTDCLLFSLEFLEELGRNMPDDCDVKKQLSQKITLYESHYTKNLIETL